MCGMLGCMTTALKEEIKKMARESFREVLREELMRGRASALPFVSAKEQRAIEKLHHKPSRRVARTLRVRI